MRIAMVLAAAATIAGCETLSGTPTATAQQAAAPAAVTAAPSVSAEQQLLEAERQLANTAQARGLGGALAGVLDPDGFIVRPGQMLTSSERISAAIPATNGPVFWQPDRVVVSQSGDMGL